MLESANKYIVIVSSIVLLITLCITLYNWFKVRKCQRSLDVLNARLTKMDASAKRFQNICTSNIQALQYSMESKQVQAPPASAPLPKVHSGPSVPSVPSVEVLQGTEFLSPEFFEPVRTTTFVISKNKTHSPPPMQSIIEEIDSEEDEVEEVDSTVDLDMELEAELEELEK